MPDGFAHYDRWKLTSPEDEEDRLEQERRRVERDRDEADGWYDRRKDDCSEEERP